MSYSRERQKLAFADEGIIQIYDLRYGVKLSSLDRYQCIGYLIASTNNKHCLRL